MFARILAALVAAICAVPAFAATWYVDCSAPTNGSGSFAAPYNTAASLNWTTIGAGDDDVLFRAGVTCGNSQLGGASGFPNALNVAGSANDYVRIGVYDPQSGNEILLPTASQRARFVGDGSTRTEMVSLFGFSYTVLNGIYCSGGSNSSGRGCIAAGANGATPPSDLFITNNEVEQGSTPTNTANHYGITVGGTGSGTTGARITLAGNLVRGIKGTSGAFGILCSNLDTCTLQENTVDARDFAGTTTGGILIQSTTDGRAVMTGHAAISNTVLGGGYCVRYLPFGFSATLPYISGARIAYNTCRDQTAQGIYAGLMRDSLMEYNTIERAGYGRGTGSGIYFAGTTGGYVGGGNASGTRIRYNDITDSGQFAIWVVGINNLAVGPKNKIKNCGTIAAANTYGRCIEFSTLASPGALPATTLTLSALTGTGITATAGAAAFAATDVDRVISGPSNNPGLCKITAFTSSTVVTCNVIEPFTSTSLAASTWPMRHPSHDLVVEYNDISGAFGRQFTTAAGTEGVGIGLDDGTSRAIVRGNRVRGSDYAAISLNQSVGSVLVGNELVGNGTDPTDVLAAANDRRSSILLGYSPAKVYNNTIDCLGDASYGIVQENSTTVNPVVPANGGVVEARNNHVRGCKLGAILLNANDIASNNHYWDNGPNYQWMVQLSFSSTPSPGDLTLQTLDGASRVSDPLTAADYSFPCQATRRSPLCSGGLYVGPYLDVVGVPFKVPPAMGAREGAWTGGRVTR